MANSRKVSIANTSWIWCLRTSMIRLLSFFNMFNNLISYVTVLFKFVYSSAQDTLTGLKVAIKKLTRPFQTSIHAKRTYRELRMLKHMNHENVRILNQMLDFKFGTWFFVFF